MEHKILDIVAYGSLICSLLYTFLPPWESFGNWPRFQSNYQFFLIFLKAGGANGRTAVSKLYGNDITATSNQSGTDPKILGKP